ncbi:MAG TPA: sialidase family protein [Polyangia bacterium]|nr:sialidase family protein [Polyangia bacterium]
MNVSCATPTLLTASAPRAHARLDLAGTAFAGCNGGTGGALFYATDVPPGQELTARALPTGGAPPWQPILVAFEACADTVCLARGRTVSAAGQLQWINNGATTRRLILAVSADGPVAGAELDLSVGVTDLLSSCERPRLVGDGDTLVNQVISNASLAAAATCFQDREPALYYQLSLRPQQDLQLKATRNGEIAADVHIGLRTKCSDACTPISGEVLDVNASTNTRTVLIEVTKATAPFDLQVTSPPPRAEIEVIPTSPLTTTEAGGQATFDIVLSSQPTARVNVSLASSRPSEGIVSPSLVSFDPASWNQRQIVTMTGVDDHVSDGSQTYELVTAPATSEDPIYAELDAEDIPVVNLDDEPGLVVEGAEDVVTSEDGAVASFTVRLEAPPSADVTVPLATSNAREGAVGASALVFTPANWNVPQTVTAAGVDDDLIDGVQPFEIVLGPLRSADARYDGLKPDAIPAHNRDDDFPALEDTVLSGARSCGVTGTVNAFPVAIDSWGRLSIVALCDGQLWLFSSADGGQTFASPVAIPNTTALTGDFVVAAGRGGTLDVAFQHGANLLVLARTPDAGVTWYERTIWTAQLDLVHVSAVRNTVAIAADDPLGSGGRSTFLYSSDGGRSFGAAQTADGVVAGMGLEPDGHAAWLIDYRRNIWRSRDGGPFDLIEPIYDGQDGCCYVFGHERAYALHTGTVISFGYADPTHGLDIAGPQLVPIAAAIDDADVVTIYGLTSVGRVTPDGSVTTPSQGGLRPMTAGAVALSRQATALATISRNAVTVSISKWP